MVVWLLGISGSGKTTLSKKLKAYYGSLGRKVYLLDGDVVRNFYDNDLGYTKEDREANIKRILLAAHVLDENGIFVVVANISPFEYLRKFARRKIKNYLQVYLHKDIGASMAKDVKGIYGEARGRTDLVGVEIPFEPPEENDLVLEVDRESEEESLQKIVELISSRCGGVV